MMDDAQWIFLTDSKEKKNIARSARNKARKTGCKLPSDFLTRKEKNAMNGAVMNYDLHKPMKYAEYKMMPVDIQKEYLQGIIDRFGVATRRIAQMLGVAEITLKKQAAKHKLVHSVRNACDEEGWSAFIDSGIWKPKKAHDIYKRMSYDTFRRLEKTEQKTYLTWLRDTFNAGISDICGMFGIVPKTLYNFMYGRFKTDGVNFRAKLQLKEKEWKEFLGDDKDEAQTLNDWIEEHKTPGVDGTVLFVQGADTPVEEKPVAKEKEELMENPKPEDSTYLVTRICISLVNLRSWDDLAESMKSFSLPENNTIELLVESAD